MACGPVKCSPFSSRSQLLDTDARPPVRKQAATPAAAPANHRRPAELSAAGTAAHSLLSLFVCLTRPPSWQPMTRPDSAPCSPSSRHPARFSANLIDSGIPSAPIWWRAGHLLARLQHLMGHSQSHHHALCATRSQGCLGPNTPGPSKTDPFGIFSHPMSQSRPSLEEILKPTFKLLLSLGVPATVSAIAGRSPLLSFLRTDFPGLSGSPTSPRSSSARCSLRCRNNTALTTQNPPNNCVCLRRLLDDLTANGHCLRPELISARTSSPTADLPRPLLHQTIYCFQQKLRASTTCLPMRWLLTPVPRSVSAE